MARVTVEDCLDKVPNRFALTVLASRRARALSEGKGTPLVSSANKVGVIALREIAKGQVRYEEDVEEVVRGFIEEQRQQLMAGVIADATFIDAASFTATDDEEEEEDDDVKELEPDPDKLAGEEEEEEAAEEEEEEEEAEDEALEDEGIDDEVDASVLEDLDGEIEGGEEEEEEAEAPAEEDED